MLGWFRSLMPKEERFFELFARHSQSMVAGARSLQGLLQGGHRVPDFCREIAAHENRADEVTREVLQAVRRTFITPFDRGDIKDLITSMDDSVDQMHQTAKAITLFELRSFEAPMQELGDLIVRGADLTAEALPLLSSIGTNSGRLAMLTEQITRIEDRADELHDQGIKALYLAHRTGDPMAYIVGTEIYGHLEKVVDRLEDVANEIHDLVIEHA